jgi:hypothetical protein
MAVLLPKSQNAYYPAEKGFGKGGETNTNLASSTSTTARSTGLIK